MYKDSLKYEVYSTTFCSRHPSVDILVTFVFVLMDILQVARESNDVSSSDYTEFSDLVNNKL